MFLSTVVLIKRLNCEETNEELLQILGMSPFHIEGAAYPVTEVSAVSDGGNCRL